ncbi:Anosmin-1 [Fasciola gigantica]|uniref:Anosmin-1 n=1 Tax=Fasciola gigantica TaxID=46835 RepID=A0A504YS35_FASGI|nr:Anosmin-1 [Fasciola gigantica]
MSYNRLVHLWNITVFLWYATHFGLCHSNTKLTSNWMEERLYLRAQCKAKCLRLFQSANEQDLFKPTWIQTSAQWSLLSKCFRNNSEHCSSECFTACDGPPKECISSCSTQGIGCRIGCHHLQESVDPRPGQCPRPADMPKPALKRSPTKLTETMRCGKECRLDSSCSDSLHKCCSIGCNRVCTQPTFNDSVPPMPDSLIPQISEVSNAILALDWSAPYSQLTKICGPIVFILQTRLCACKMLDATQLSDWQTLIMTHQFGAKLDAFEPGKMYQFRIAAVSPHGTRGFGPETEAYPSRPEIPSVPSPPRNVTDSMWRFYSSGSISVLLSWQPPIRTDLPITEYVINWVVDHGYVQSGGHSLEGLTQFSQKVAPDRLQYVIQNLKPATSYKVQVIAVSYWHGHGQLKSQPNTIFLSTQSIHPVYTRQSTMEDRFRVSIRSFPTEQKSNCECGLDDPAQKLFRLEKTFYDRGSLMAKFLFKPPNKGTDHLVEWSPHVCINSKENDILTLKQHILVSSRTRAVTLGNLSFNCRYMVKITSVDGQRQSGDRNWFDSSHDSSPLTAMSPFDDHDLVSVKRSCFCTPSCLEVEVAEGPAPINCSPTDPGPPPPPAGLTAAQTSSPLSYRIQWNPPKFDETQSETLTSSTLANRQRTRAALSNQSPLLGTKYRVIWAPRVEEPVNKEMYNDDVGFSPIMDTQQSDVRIVEENQTWIELRDLQSGTFYIVRVQTLITSETGYQRESSPVAVYFVTPVKTGLLESEIPNSDDRNGSSSSAPQRTNDRMLTWVQLVTVIIAPRFIKNSV